MSAATTGKSSKKGASEPRTNWGKLRSRTDAQTRRALTRDPDVHSTDETFWATAEVVMPRPKKIVTMRLDADLLDWFRANRGYQTRINAVLRAYMNSQAQQR
jgi:uncharacterized protein (DUF4415 family)